MGVIELTELKGVLDRESRLLGLDVGTKTIGLALSDVNLSVASPLDTVKRTKLGRDAEAIRNVVNEHGVGGLVVGLPVSMDGTEGPKCQSVRDFTRALLEKLSETGQAELAAAFWDERLSTAAVERMLVNEADMTRKRRAQVVDKAAAAYILQGALDALKEMGTGMEKE